MYACRVQLMLRLVGAVFELICCYRLTAEPHLRTVAVALGYGRYMDVGVMHRV